MSSAFCHCSCISRLTNSTICVVSFIMMNLMVHGGNNVLRRLPPLSFRCSCCSCTCVDTDSYICGENGGFACIDPTALCVDDDDITIEKFENCGWVSWNGRMSLGPAAPRLVAWLNRFRTAARGSCARHVRNYVALRAA